MAGGYRLWSSSAPSIGNFHKLKDVSDLDVGGFPPKTRIHGFGEQTKIMTELRPHKIDLILASRARSPRLIAHKQMKDGRGWHGMGSAGMELRTEMEEKWRPTAAHRSRQHIYICVYSEVCEAC